MFSLLLLNFSLLGNITTTLNLSDNFIPKSEVSVVQLSEFNYTKSINQGPRSNLSFENLNDLNLKVSKPKAVVKPIIKTPKQENKPVLNGGSLSISKIGIANLKLGKSSISTIADMDKKMLYAPVIETEISPDLCSDYGNSYVTGHSEPAKAGDKNFPGVDVFSDLNLLEIGDIINVTNAGGLKCSYKVTGWDQATTDSNNKVSKDIFSNAYFPEFDKPMLTIQTCKKGSATVRLLLRAEKIS